jgi:hypothetical protein
MAAQLELETGWGLKNRDERNWCGKVEMVDVVAFYEAGRSYDASKTILEYYRRSDAIGDSGQCLATTGTRTAFLRRLFNVSNSDEKMRRWG